MSSVRSSIRSRAAVLVLPVAFMWVVLVFDAFLPDGMSAAGHGIIPRTVAGLYGIPMAPFIHANWAHLAANSIPLLVLGALVLIDGIADYLFVVVTTIVVGGLGTWLFGRAGTEHVGASGVIFGLFGFLVFRSFYDRRVGTILMTILVGVVYGLSMAWSLVPAPGISWTGHFFGFIGGFVAARMRYARPEGMLDRVNV